MAHFSAQRLGLSSWLTVMKHRIPSSHLGHLNRPTLPPTTTASVLSQHRSFSQTPTHASTEHDSENFWRVPADDHSFWDAYVSTRPNYSRSFYNLIYSHHATHSSSFQLAHDVGCGAGQVAAELSTRFQHIVASDINDTHCWNSQVAGNMRRIGCRANRLCEWKIFTCEPYRVIHYEMYNPTKCIIFSLIISPLLPASTMTTSTKAYRMQLALAELKQQEKPNISATSKKYQLIQSTLYHY